MNVKGVFACAVVLATGTLLFSGSAFGQFGGQVKVSNTIPTPVSGVSSARCGGTIVVGFGDSEPPQSPAQSSTFDGFAYSQNGGATFTDGGTLPVPPPGPQSFGPNSLGAGLGNPSLGCSSPTHFYYASTYKSTDPICAFPECPSISVSASADGGKTWGLPVVVATGTGDTHSLLFPSLAVDPTSLARLYVAYIDDNEPGPLDFAFADCGGANRVTEVRMGVSTDGGKTWTTNVVDHACDLSTNPDHQGLLDAPNTVVSPGGKVYVTYEFHPQSSSPLPNEIRFTRSLDQGKTFTTAINVSKDAINNALPQLAVDRTTSTHRGEIYLTWSGTPTGTYTDVLVSDSLNFGLSFSFPRPISPAPTAGNGQRFQTNPVIAVDNDGQVVDCFYSTPSNVPTGSSVYSYNCATSFNHAASWTAQRLATSAPVGFDAVTSEFLLHVDGFLTAFELTSAGQNHMVGEKSDLN
jgi:hypothetical protein